MGKDDSKISYSFFVCIIISELQTQLIHMQNVFVLYLASSLLPHRYCSQISNISGIFHRWANASNSSGEIWQQFSQLLCLLNKLGLIKWYIPINWGVDYFTALHAAGVFLEEAFLFLSYTGSMVFSETERAMTHNTPGLKTEGNAFFFRPAFLSMQV